ncbi:non-specific serine/threonine protein kinase [Ranunculus cassubicifolius]
MDSSLEGQYANEDATQVPILLNFLLNAFSLKLEIDPTPSFLVAAVATIQKQREVASHVLIGLLNTPTVMPTVTVVIFITVNIHV